MRIGILKMLSWLFRLEIFTQEEVKNAVDIAVWQKTSKQDMLVMNRIPFVNYNPLVLSCEFLIRDFELNKERYELELANKISKELLANNLIHYEITRHYGPNEKFINGELIVFDTRRIRAEQKHHNSRMTST